MAVVIRRRSVKLAALGLLVIGIVVPAISGSGDENRRPDLGDCQKLQAPATHKVAFAAYAEGVQIYRWNGTTWSFVAPEAVLYSGDGEDDEIVGIHYGGPTWESNSGSKVVCTVSDRCTPDPNAIPWLLLGAVYSEGPGIFQGVTHIQRVYTLGGLAPANPGDFVGAETRVPYTAWYFFYREHR
jgi:hypothetical protein